jgi:hypothetical protein
MKIILEKTIENEVNYISENGEKISLKVNKQQTKGEGKEVVDIEKVVGENYQKWVSLSKLNIGENEVELKPRKQLTIEKYSLTKEEEEEIKQLENRINEIKENAKRRYIPKIDFTKIDVEKLSDEQKVELMEKLEKYLEVKRG